MSQILRASILATVAAGVLSLVPDASAQGRADWQNYAWQKFSTSKCLPNADGMLTCPPYHQKWDWKRNQWVNIAIAIDPARHSLTLVQRLTDRDSHDQDYVCVTALVLDAQGNDLVAHHQNWEISAGQVLTDTFAYVSPMLDRAASIHIGSKQCRDGAGQDDAVYAAVLARLGT
ncbi:hypothetical protein [uncultured Devosia sp.]|uniref:hypothetical protein n=1 Tax=uncultured Devosia sp. TaxID=211434 RepID=UPI0035CC0575